MPKNALQEIKDVCPSSTFRVAEATTPNVNPRGFLVFLSSVGMKETANVPPIPRPRAESSVYLSFCTSKSGPIIPLIVIFVLMSVVKDGPKPMAMSAS